MVAGKDGLKERKGKKIIKKMKKRCIKLQ